jgi:hypothetical protein
VGDEVGAADLQSLEVEGADALEQSLALAQHDRCDVQAELVDCAECEYWFTVAAPPAMATWASPAASRACPSADSIPSVTKWNVVPPCIGSGRRGLWVRTKTGPW